MDIRACSAARKVPILKKKKKNLLPCRQALNSEVQAVQRGVVQADY